jgi:hypothetical protein
MAIFTGKNIDFPILFGTTVFAFMLKKGHCVASCLSGITSASGTEGRRLESRPSL